MSPQWHRPRTWIAGEAVLPWHFRTDLRDNVRILRKKQHSTAMVYISSGKDFNVRTENETSIAFESIAWHYDNVAGSGERVSKLTASVSGLHEVWFVIDWNDDGASSGVRMVRLVINGADSDMPAWCCEPGAATNDRCVQPGYFLVVLEAGDEVELNVQHTSTTSEFSVNSGLQATRFGLDFIGETTDSPTSWTTPTTWAAGDRPTHDDFNAQIRDNLLNLRNCRGVAAITRLDANAAITVGTATALSWGSAPLNMGSVWDSGTPTRLTAPVTGWYAASGFFRWDGGNSGQRRHDVRQSGGFTYRGHTTSRISDGSRGTAVSLYMELNLDAGNYIEFVVTSNQTIANATVYMAPTYGSLVLLGDQ